MIGPILDRAWDASLFKVFELRMTRPRVNPRIGMSRHEFFVEVLKAESWDCRPSFVCSLLIKTNLRCNWEVITFACSRVDGELDEEEQ